MYKLMVIIHGAIPDSRGTAIMFSALEQATIKHQSCPSGSRASDSAGRTTCSYTFNACFL